MRKIDFINLNFFLVKTKKQILVLNLKEKLKTFGY